MARSNKDWHQLIELCAIFGTMLADQDGLYDPTDYNDRLLLGLRGIMNEAELHVLRGRLHQALLSKAKRGEVYGAKGSMFFIALFAPWREYHSSPAAAAA